MRFSIKYAVALASLMFSSGTASAQYCADMGATELIGGMRICVSSTLSPQSGNTYGPDNLLDGNDRTAWCEGVSGNGEGQEIEIAIFDASPFRRITIQNGYAKSQKVYQNNGRIRTIEVQTDRGDRFRTQLPDTPSAVIVNLPQLAEYRGIYIKVIDVYPGAKYQDTCLNFISPDLEYERYLEFESQGLLQD